MDTHDKKLQQLIRDADRRHDVQGLSDLLAMAAISISNAVDCRNREAREDRETVKRYEPAEIALFLRCSRRLPTRSRTSRAT
jgi:hypothetical protein